MRTGVLLPAAAGGGRPRPEGGPRPAGTASGPARGPGTDRPSAASASRQLRGLGSPADRPTARGFARRDTGCASRWLRSPARSRQARTTPPGAGKLPADGREPAAVAGWGHLRPAAMLAAAVLLAWTTPAPPAAAQPLAPETGDARAGTWTPELAAYGRASPSRDAPWRCRSPGGGDGRRRARPAGREAQVLARLDAPGPDAAVAKLQAADRGAGLAEQRLAGLRQREKASLATRDDELQGEVGGERGAGGARRGVAGPGGGARGPRPAAGPGRPRRPAGRPAGRARARALAEVRAPFAGVVAAAPASAGAILAAGSPLARVEDLDRAVVEVAVAADALDGWRQGAASAETPGGPDPAPADDGAPRLDPGTGLRLLRYATDDAAGRLGDGEWVKVTARGQGGRAGSRTPPWSRATGAPSASSATATRRAPSRSPPARPRAAASRSWTGSPPGSGWSRPAPTSCSTATSTGSSRSRTEPDARAPPPLPLRRRHRRAGHPRRRPRELPRAAGRPVPRPRLPADQHRHPLPGRHGRGHRAAGHPAGRERGARPRRPATRALRLGAGLLAGHGRVRLGGRRAAGRAAGRRPPGPERRRPAGGRPAGAREHRHLARRALDPRADRRRSGGPARAGRSTTSPSGWARCRAWRASTCWAAARPPGASTSTRRGCCSTSSRRPTSRRRSAPATCSTPAATSSSTAATCSSAPRGAS